jgi:Ribbon-helix-helix domain
MAIGPAREDPRPDERSSLVIRNVRVQGHRTSVRFEPQMWDSMIEICRLEFCTPDDVCSLCRRTQAAARLTEPAAAGFHARLFSQFIDRGWTHERWTWAEHVHVAAAGPLAYARHQDTAGYWIPDGLRASAALPALMALPPPVPLGSRLP